MADLLTVDEHETVRVLGDVWNLLCKLVGDGPPRDSDLAEAASHIHALQHFVMAQAAARAYPDAYRLAGAPPAVPLAADLIVEEDFSAGLIYDEDEPVAERGADETSAPEQPEPRPGPPWFPLPTKALPREEKAARDARCPHGFHYNGAYCEDGCNESVAERPEPENLIPCCDHCGCDLGMRDGHDDTCSFGYSDSEADAGSAGPVEPEWTCIHCGAHRWVGWRRGPEHEGWPRRAQCVPCGCVQDLPAPLQEGDQ